MTNEILRESARRRSFAIISHPDAGKTTLTEKLLLYAGAIEEAGAVKARAGRQRDARSDWMEMERQRGISITSTVLQFEHDGHILNLLDTPGHRDFSEDTYRVVAAVDAAVIVLDAAKGVEEQTLKLFEVAKARQVPLITFVNKCDRPGLSPLAILDDIEARLGLRATPVTWPVGLGVDFKGVVDRREGLLHRFQRTAHGARLLYEQRLPSSQLQSMGEEGERAASELDLLREVGADHDQKAFLVGETTPVFFGSALWNFGVRLLLDAVVELAPPPEPLSDSSGLPHPLDGAFSGFVFKVQSNLDPRHRDRVAYLRVCSGRFERGMTLWNSRTGRSLPTKYAHQMFGRERGTVELAYPGDVVGLVNASDCRIGDTLTEGGQFAFPPIPKFAPEHFNLVRNLDTGRYKQFRRGITQLDEEGIVQVLHRPERSSQEPLLAAVGPLQFEVAVHRLQTEFGVDVEMTPTPYTLARRTDSEAVEILAGARNVEVVMRTDGAHLALFTSRFQLEALQRDQPRLRLHPLVSP